MRYVICILFIYHEWSVCHRRCGWGNAPSFPLVKIWANLPHRDVGVTDHGLEASEVSFRSSKLRRFGRFRWFRWFRLGPFWCFSGWLNFSNFGMLELNKKSVHAKKIGKSERPTRIFFFFRSTSWVFAGKALPVPKYQGASPSGEAHIF